MLPEYLEQTERFEKTEEVAAWDALAGEWGAYDEFSELVCEKLEQAIGKSALLGMRVLDVGCGAGALAMMLAERCGAGLVVGTDISSKMIEAAQKRRDEVCGASENHAVRFVCVELDEDTTRLPEWKEKFDLVVSGSVMHCVQDADAFVRSLCVAGKSGARFAHFVWLSKKAADAGVDFMFHEGFASEAALQSALERCGLVDVQVSSVSFFDMTMLSSISAKP